MKRLRKLIKLWRHQFNRDDSFLRPYKDAELRAEWAYIDRVDRVKRMSGGYPTGEKP